MESIQEPRISRKVKFIDQWSMAEIVNARLGSMLVIMGISFVSLTVAFIYVLVKPKPIYYVPGAVSTGIAYAQTDSKQAVAMFASSWVLNWSNFNQMNVEEVYKRAARFMSPRLLNQTKARLKKDIEQVKKNNVTSLFSLNQEPLVQEEKEGFHIVLQGDKGVYMGKEEIKLQKMVYRVQIITCPPTDWNPYGFMIQDVDQEVKE